MNTEIKQFSNYYCYYNPKENCSVITSYFINKCYELSLTVDEYKLDLQVAEAVRYFANSTYKFYDQQTAVIAIINGYLCFGIAKDYKLDNIEFKAVENAILCKKGFNADFRVVVEEHPIIFYPSFLPLVIDKQPTQLH